MQPVPDTPNLIVLGFALAAAITTRSPPTTETDTPGAAPITCELTAVMDVSGSGVVTYATEPGATLTDEAVAMIVAGADGAAGDVATGGEGGPVGDVTTGNPGEVSLIPKTPPAE